ncbi:MAG TPA: sulfatase-like hydrolase/transferase [Chitinophagaceae bacterium]|nr:sulfatase-like hydrolase/transferase [Chitinophagaceae bacterium]
MITLLFTVATFINLAIAFLFKKSKFSVAVFHTVNFLFLLFIVTFYLLILSSNYFWKKTITIKIIKNYFSSLNELVNTIPVQKWILVSAPVLVICLVSVVYFVTKPSFEKIKTTAFKIKGAKRQLLIFSAITLITVFLFKSQIMDLKRRMHFAEEPLLIFTFGSMWQGSGEEMAFDRARYDNGLKDQACFSAISKQPGQPDHNFIIILVDGLRSDHLSLYGYDRKTTPFLDSLSTAGHLSFVKNAFSSSTNTIGGIAGLFYSKDWDKFGYNGLNIPKFLKKAGYKNHAFLTGFHKEWYGLSALYRNDCDYYYESSMNYDESFRVDDDFKTLEVIKNTKLPQNSFVFIHLLSVHHVGKKYKQFKKYLPDKIGFSVDKKEALINNYDNGILQTDHIIKEIFSKLATDQLLESSTIFIVADHGELFGEDGRWSHGGDIHEKLLEVPLILYDKHAQIKNTEGGSLLDIAPTIAERIGYPSPACWQGFSLLKEAKDFTLQVFSNDENIEYPYGYLAMKDSTYTLHILDKNKNPAITKRKTNGVWRKIQ